MADDIFLIQDNGALIEMGESEYDSEALLQELLANYPKLLAGGQIDSASPRRWLLIKREMRIPAEEDGAGRWSVDHLFVDQDAIPTLVEVKRSSDTRIRREVVGQMLDYAANAVVYWPVEQMRAEFEKNCDDPEGTLDKLLRGETSPEEFWQTVKLNLQAGRIRMLFVADVIPPELRQIVEFLNKQMDPAEVLAIEIKQYHATDGTGLRTLVPRVIGQTSRKGGAVRRSDETRLAFWTAFHQQTMEQGLQPASDSPSGETALVFQTGDPDLRLVARADRHGYLSIALRLDGAEAQARWEVIQSHLEHAGSSLTKRWQCGYGKKKRGFVISAVTDLDLDAREQWPQKHQWLIEAVCELRDALLPLISGSK